MRRLGQQPQHHRQRILRPSPVILLPPEARPGAMKAGGKNPIFPTSDAGDAIPSTQHDPLVPVLAQPASLSARREGGRHREACWTGPWHAIHLAHVKTLNLSQPSIPPFPSFSAHRSPFPCTAAAATPSLHKPAAAGSLAPPPAVLRRASFSSSTANTTPRLLLLLWHHCATSSSSTTNPDFLPCIVSTHLLPPVLFFFLLSPPPLPPPAGGPPLPGRRRSRAASPSAAGRTTTSAGPPPPPRPPLRSPAMGPRNPPKPKLRHLDHHPGRRRAPPAAPPPPTGTMFYPTTAHHCCLCHTVPPAPPLPPPQNHHRWHELAMRHKRHELEVPARHDRTAGGPWLCAVVPLRHGPWRAGRPTWPSILTVVTHSIASPLPFRTPNQKPSSRPPLPAPASVTTMAGQVSSTTRFSRPRASAALASTSSSSPATTPTDRVRDPQFDALITRVLSTSIHGALPSPPVSIHARLHTLSSSSDYDRLSNLPDALLRNIVSRLPIKDGARTAILSRRWLPIWLAAPLALYDPHLLPGPTTSDSIPRQVKRADSDAVVAAVSRILDAHGGPFRCAYLTCSNMDGDHRTRLARWLHHLAVKGVEELFLINRPPLHLERSLPATFFSMASLTRLYLCFLRFPATAGLPRGAAFPSLRELGLCSVAMEGNGDVEFILARSPVLEMLCFVGHMLPLLRLRLVSRSLRCVQIHYSKVKSIAVVDAPCLARLIVMNTPLAPVSSCSISIGNAPSLQLFGYFDPSKKVNEPAGKLNFKFWQEAGAIECIESHVKLLVFHDFRGENSELAFLKFFVESAQVLEKLVIVCSNGCFSSMDEANSKVKKTLFAGKKGTERCALLVLEAAPKEETASWTYNRGFDFSSGPAVKEGLGRLAANGGGGRDCSGVEAVGMPSEPGSGGTPSQGVSVRRWRRMAMEVEAGGGDEVWVGRGSRWKKRRKKKEKRVIAGPAQFSSQPARPALFPPLSLLQLAPGPAGSLRSLGPASRHGPLVRAVPYLRLSRCNARSRTLAYILPLPYPALLSLLLSFLPRSNGPPLINELLIALSMETEILSPPHFPLRRNLSSPYKPPFRHTGTPFHFPRPHGHAAKNPSSPSPLPPPRSRSLLVATPTPRLPPFVARATYRPNLDENPPPGIYKSPSSSRAYHRRSLELYRPPPRAANRLGAVSAALSSLIRFCATRATLRAKPSLKPHLLTLLRPRRRNVAATARRRPSPFAATPASPGANIVLAPLRRCAAVAPPPDVAAGVLLSPISQRHWIKIQRPKALPNRVNRGMNADMPLEEEGQGQFAEEEEQFFEE
ncbi:hypothetical protein HU200_048033 [Digitaria exilis]|uniref:F-box domain-containing protein n=1 Tax=Digitaria exilis TaxID=1010633 RepID=A0A835ATA3_9POAL|nr:hypothetical protein HU200_048033 [Digitaria exilis]